MTIDEMFNELENKVRDTFIVTLKYKYDFEEYYTIGNHILEYDCLDDSYVWLNDWYEGQTDVEVLGYMLLGDVDTTKLLSCEDAISRSECLDTINELLAPYIPKMMQFTLPLDLAIAINKLPSVTPKPKMGEWIKEHHTIRCNNCNTIVFTSCDYNDREEYRNMVMDDYIEQYKYCPECGARMNGGGEE